MHTYLLCNCHVSMVVQRCLPVGAKIFRIALASCYKLQTDCGLILFEIVTPVHFLIFDDIHLNLMALRIFSSMNNDLLSSQRMPMASVSTD